MKAYIMACPATGKTTFIKNNGSSYGVLTLYDHDSLPKPNDSSALVSMPNNSCILGKCHIPAYDDVIYVSVVIALNRLHENVEKRRKTRNDYWAQIDNVINDKDFGYNRLIEITEEFCIPRFDNIEESIKFILSS